MNTHAYSLIEAKEVINRDDNSIVRVVFIRNPYADNPGQNVSRWNQTSLEMPNNVKEQLGITDEMILQPDGRFYMPIETFYKSFY